MPAAAARTRLVLTTLITLSALAAACNASPGLPSLAPPASALPSSEPSATATHTAIPPSPTPLPPAATVNGETITQETLEAELNRYKMAQERPDSVDEAQAREIVLNELIDQLLLAQGARAAGFVLDAATLQAHTDAVIAEAGSQQAIQDWIAAQGYTQESFEEALSLSIEAAWMRDRIISTVPEQAEQVHARQIFLYTLEEAQQALRELQSGKDFGTLAAIYDPQMGGELGWFPRGVLVDARLDEAVFSLEPESYSDIVESSVGFHILQLLERDPQRPLDPEARLIWQEKALKEWIEGQRGQSEIVIIKPET